MAANFCPRVAPNFNLVHLRVIGSRKNDDLYTLAGMEDGRVVMLIELNRKTDDETIQVFDADGSPLIDADRNPFKVPYTNVRSQGALIGRLHLELTYGSMIMKLVPTNPSLNTLFVRDEDEMEMARKPKPIIYNLCFMDTPTDRAMIFQHGHASSLTVNVSDGCLDFVHKVLTVILAVQLLCDHLGIHKMHAPVATLAMPMMSNRPPACNNLPTYLVDRKIRKGSTCLPNCFALRMAGLDECGNIEYYDMMDLVDQSTNFFIEYDRSLDRAYLVHHDDGKLCLFDGVKAEECPMHISTETGALLGQINGDKIISTQAVGNTQMRLRKKKFPDSYDDAFGSNDWYFIEPDIALIANVQCTLGTQFRTNNMLQQTRLLVLGMGIRLNSTVFEFDKGPMPLINYYGDVSRFRPRQCY